MKKIIALITLLFSFSLGSAQEGFLGFGPNQTVYDYTNSEGSTNNNIFSDNGTHFEGGYVIFTRARKLSITTSVTFDQFNAIGGNSLNDYSWRTSFAGLQGGIRYGLIDEGTDADIHFFINVGATIKKMISGTQKINGEVFNLNSEGEFNGLFKGGYFGPELRYLANEIIAVGLGYTYSLNFGTTKEGQTLNINSGAFVLKLYSSFDY